jgi:hypothetical protein
MGNVFFTSGTLTLRGIDASPFGVFDNTELTLGGTSPDAGVTLLLDDAITGAFYTIDDTNGFGYGTIDVIGDSAIEGPLVRKDARGLLAINVASASTLRLMHGSYMQIFNGGTATLSGLLIDETTIFVDGRSSFINSGTIEAFAGSVTFASGATISGTGTLDAGLQSSLNFLGNDVPATQVVRFDDPAGTVRIAQPSTFLAPIENFATGDAIDLTTIVADYASFNTAGDELTVRNGGSLGVVVATLDVSGPSRGTLVARSDGGTGTNITFTATPSQIGYEADTADRAMNANLVRNTMTTATGARIDGTGIKIGILSVSFNSDGSADAEAAAGFLPANMDGSSAVHVLKDGAGVAEGDTDEGRAMAELIHQIAPGAEIDFYTADFGQDDFAAGIGSLVADGCNIIVDDISFGFEPFYQIAGPVDTAILSAIDHNVDYFAAAGNEDAISFELPGTAPSPQGCLMLPRRWYRPFSSATAHRTS